MASQFADLGGLSRLEINQRAQKISETSRHKTCNGLKTALYRVSGFIFLPAVRLLMRGTAH